MHLFVVFLCIVTALAYEPFYNYEAEDGSHQSIYINSISEGIKPVNIVPDPNITALYMWYLESLKIWTGQFCEIYPNLQQLSIHMTELQEIQPHSFDNCSGLTYLFLGDNQLNKIDETTFRKVTKLKELLLVNNILTTFSPDIVKGLTNLIYLDISHNLIFEIDYAGIKRNCPSLSFFLINDNNIRCMNAQRIVDADTTSKLLELNENWLRRDRTYNVSYIEGMECVSDKQWIGELREHILENPDLHHLVTNNSRPMNMTIGDLQIDDHDRDWIKQLPKTILSNQTI